jgi:cytochrome d ubiquinol oxidase subunit II
MAVSILAYVVLDGYDLGVGLLLQATPEEAERDRMVASIGPLLGRQRNLAGARRGLLLVAFPVAHGMVLTALYMPVALMLCGLILRGVAFEFRAKAVRRWTSDAGIGPSPAGLGPCGIDAGLDARRYVLGFEQGLAPMLFATLAAFGVAAAYAFIGACWLIWPDRGRPAGAGGGLGAGRALGRRRRHRRGLGGDAARLGADLRALVRDAEPAAARSLAGCNLGLILGLRSLLRHMPLPDDKMRHVPFWGAVGLFCQSFAGLTWSFFPYIVRNG